MITVDKNHESAFLFLIEDIMRNEDEMHILSKNILTYALNDNCQRELRQHIFDYAKHRAFTYPKSFGKYVFEFLSKLKHKVFWLDLHSIRDLWVQPNNYGVGGVIPENKLMELSHTMFLFGRDSITGFTRDQQEIVRSILIPLEHKYGMGPGSPTLQITGADPMLFGDAWFAVGNYSKAIAYYEFASCIFGIGGSGKTEALLSTANAILHLVDTGTADNELDPGVKEVFLQQAYDSIRAALANSDDFDFHHFYRRKSDRINPIVGQLLVESMTIKL